MYEQDSEPAIIAEKMTRLLSEAEPPLKSTQDQEVTTEWHLLISETHGVKKMIKLTISYYFI